MRFFHVAVASALVLFVIATSTLAAVPNPAWTAGYPKPGANNGEIAVKGTFNVPNGWSTTGTMIISVVPSGGGEQLSTTINIGANQTGAITWGESVIGGLVSGTSYHVEITIGIKMMGANNKNYSPDTGSAAAK